MFPEMGSSPVFPEEDGSTAASAEVGEDRVVLRASPSGSGRRAALARILAADAIGGSSCKEYF
jgi:hypothetical protein